MNYKLSKQQQDIVDTVMKVPQVPLIVVQARAGCAKTSTTKIAVQELLKRNKDTKITVLVYGKANQIDIEQTLPKSVTVSTIHAFAYKYTVNPLRLKTPIRSNIRVSDLIKYIKIDKKELNIAIKLTEEFLVSDYVSVAEFVEQSNNELYTNNVIDHCLKILRLMEKGKVNITHSFYLKLFHGKVLNGTIKLDPIDTLIVEEAQDLSKIMVDVAERYPATQKIYSGDVAQAILGFTGSMNVLDKYKDIALELPLTKSFRVNTKDALVVQTFMQTFTDKDFEFEGHDKPYPDNPTKAYLTRTNAALIDKMIELDREGIPYKLSTKTKLNQLFSLPLTLASLKKGGKQYDSEMQYLQDACDKYYTSPILLAGYKNLFSYFRFKYRENNQVIQALDLVSRHGAKTLFSIHKSAKAHMKTECNLTLATVHVSKGDTKTEVELDPSCDKALTKVLNKRREEYTREDIEEINLAYVSYTRHTHKLTGSKIFDKIKHQLYKGE